MQGSAGATSVAIGVTAAGLAIAYYRRYCHRVLGTHGVNASLPLTTPPLHFGILGCANIAVKFCVSVADCGDAVIAAVASRSLAKAEEYIAENCPGAIAYASYQALLDDPNIEAVYIPLPTATRTQWALKAVAAGKHVLLEKPVGPNASEAAEIVAACKAAGVLYMDNTMFMHHARLKSMRRALDEPSFGPVKSVSSSFTVAVPAEHLDVNIRVQRNLEPLGAIGDLAWYNIRFSLWAFGYQLPVSCSTHVHATSAEGVATAATGTLRYADGRYATFDCSFHHCLRQRAEVVSEHRTLALDDFVIPSKPEGGEYSIFTGGVGEKAIHFPRRVLASTEIVHPLEQHAILVRHFCRLARQGPGPKGPGATITREAQQDAWSFWPQISLLTQAVVDACAASGAQGGAWVDVVPPRPLW